MSEEPGLYPLRKTGTSQDLLAIIARAHERELARANQTLPRKGALQRLLLEAPIVAAGVGASLLMRLLPADLVLRLHERVFGALASPHSYPFDPASPALARARDLAGRIARESGREPALFALISHPPVMGELAHLNFELVRHAMLALRGIRGRPCRPRLVVAIDPFALDTLSIVEEGLYAGLMGHYHLGLDRMAYGRNAASRWLLRGMAWDRMPGRLIRVLSGGGELGMVLAGGVPSTTRALYGLREWLSRVRRLSPLKGRPGEVAARLRRDPAFSRFEAAQGVALGPSVWRVLEAWAMSGLTGAFAASGEGSGAAAGRLDPAARESLARTLSVLDLPSGKAEAAIQEFEGELSRETPYRFRFFRILAGRVLKRRPAVLLPVVHRLGSPHRIELREPWACLSYAEGRLGLRAPDGGESRLPLEDFVLRFVGENFA